MTILRFCILCLLVLAIGGLASAQTAPAVRNFRCFEADTFAAGLNDTGQVVGWYGEQFESSHGFLRKKDGACEAIDVPGANATIALGINDPGQIVGIYFSSDHQNGSAFLYEKGVYHTFDFPNPGLTQQVCQTFAMGINNRGQIVGFYDLWRQEGSGSVCDGPDRPFLREPDGTFVALQLGLTTDSAQINAINPRGMMVGNYLQDNCPENDCKEYGFLRHPEGVTTLILPESAVDAMPTGVNSQGQVVGRYFLERWLAPIGPCHSFFMDTNGATVEISYPGASFTCVGGINAPGEVSGAWTDGDQWYAFVVDLKALLPKQ